MQTSWLSRVCQKLYLLLPPSSLTFMLLQIMTASQKTVKEEERPEMDTLVVLLSCGDCIYADGINLLKIRTLNCFEIITTTGFRWKYQIVEFPPVLEKRIQTIQNVAHSVWCWLLAMFDWCNSLKYNACDAWSQVQTVQFFTGYLTDGFWRVKLKGYFISPISFGDINSTIQVCI